MGQVETLSPTIGVVDAVDPKYGVEKEADDEQREECEDDGEQDEENTLPDLAVVNLPKARNQDRQDRRKSSALLATQNSPPGPVS
jgi:hypothetical protein